MKKINLLRFYLIKVKRKKNDFYVFDYTIFKTEKILIFVKLDALSVIMF